MSFLGTIILIGTATPSSISQHLYDSKKTAAQAQFDNNLMLEVQRQLKINNIAVTEAEWDNFVATRITKATITDGGLVTNYILLDATIVTGEITDFGIILAKYHNEGYIIDILEPSTKITSYE